MAEAKHDRHACEHYRKNLAPCKDCLGAYSEAPEPMCAAPVVEAPDEDDKSKVTGEYANVPPGWAPQTWGAHLASLAWMKALGREHFSFTSPARHVKAHTKKILEDDRQRIVKILRAAKGSNMMIEMKILRGDLP
jgi:hypothetical protein